MGAGRPAFCLSVCPIRQRSSTGKWTNPHCRLPAGHPTPHRAAAEGNTVTILWTWNEDEQNGEQLCPATPAPSVNNDRLTLFSA